MIKIYLDKGTKLKDINKVINSILTKDEKVQGRFMALNSIESGFYTGFYSNIFVDKNSYNKIFQEYAREYIVVPTNKKILLLGIGDFNSCITGVREIDYDEITKFEFEDMRLKIELNKGSYFNLEVYYNYDNDKYALLAISAIDYIINQLGEEKMFIYQLKFSRLLLWILIIVAIALFIKINLMEMGF